MTAVRVWELRPEQYPDWDLYVAGHPDGTVFHSASWLSRTGSKLKILAALDEGGTIRGGVALVGTRRAGCYGFHPAPYEGVHAPLAGPSTKARSSGRRQEEMAVLLAILDALPQVGHVDFYLRGSRSDSEPVNILPFLWSGFTATVRYTFEIGCSVDEYLAGMVRSKRRDVRRARELVAQGDLVIQCDGELEDLVPLHGEVAEKRSFRFRQKVLSALFPPSGRGECWKAFVVRERSGQPLAGALLLLDRGRGYGIVNGATARGGRQRDLAYLLSLDLMVRECLETGRVFDFRGSSLLGVADYFIAVGGRPVACYRLQRSRSKLFFALRAGQQFLHESRSRQRQSDGETHEED